MKKTNEKGMNNVRIVNPMEQLKSLKKTFIYKWSTLLLEKN